MINPNLQAMIKSRAERDVVNLTSRPQFIRREHGDDAAQFYLDCQQAEALRLRALFA